VTESSNADFYADPLIYDVLHAPGTAGEVRALLRIVKRFMPVAQPLRFLEPACGTGRYLLALARKGHHCTGFDLSPEMIAYAKAAALERDLASRVRLFSADMRTFDQGRRLGTFNVAFNLINTIRHLSSDAAIIEHLEAVRRRLLPGGVYLVGLSLCAYGREAPTEDTWTGKIKGMTVTQVVQYLPSPGSSGKARDERVISHMSVTASGATRHIDSTYVLRGYDLAQWRKVTRAAGFEIAACVASDGSGEVEPVEPGYFVFVLKASEPQR
jgi:SAM-dependent methyltransferase